MKHLKRKKVEKILGFLLAECVVAAILAMSFFCMKSMDRTSTATRPTQATLEEDLNNNIDDTTQTEQEEEPVVEFVPTTTNVNIKMVGDCLIHEPLYLGAKQDDGSCNSRQTICRAPIYELLRVVQQFPQRVTAMIPFRQCAE